MDITLDATPGNSSMPPPPGAGAIAMISAALQAVDNDRMPASIQGIAGEMLATVAPEMRLPLRVVMSNLWLFGPIVQKQLEAGASTNALLRTTTALTVIRGGDADNVLPGQVEATVNYRLLPGDRSSDMLARLKAQIARAVGHGRFALRTLAGGSEASRVTPTDAQPYQLINRTIREVFPGTVVTPGLMVGGTDSRHFEGISDHIFRFSPVRARAEDLPGF